MDTIKVVMLSLTLAFLAESMVEYILGTPFKKFEKLQKFSWALMYVALGVGVGLAFAYQLDIIALITDKGPTTVGIILSGLAVGRGANYIHDLYSKYVLKKPDLLG